VNHVVNSVQITEVNALHFLQAIEEAILDGFYADTSIESYPQLGFPLSVRMFKGDKPELRFDLGAEVVEANIAEYDPITFVLNFQSAALQGFTVQDQGTNIDPVGLKAASMRRSVQKANVVLALDKDVPETTTEASKPKQPARKQTKSKEV
jgi:hypothetical protein